MKTTLIADAGSTKVEWLVIDSDGKEYPSVVTDGINALLCNHEDLLRAVKEAASLLPSHLTIEEIHYYGAGCATRPICEKMESALHDVWPHSEIFVDSDLLGAARSLFGKSKGIACILGTGSNSCLYDGTGISRQIPSLGYILGDEGSGAALGKRLVSDAFKLQFPENIREKFLAKYKLTLPRILDAVYREPAPNKFLASLVPFISENLLNPYIYSMVLAELTEFVKRNVAMYPGAHSLEIGVTGSIAFHFQRVLKEAIASQGYRVSKISETPMTGLVNYHKNA